jgi:hypothetical protein
MLALPISEHLAFQKVIINEKIWGRISDEI